MTVYADFIKKIQPLPYEKYAGVSSREKLVVYTIHYLKVNNIPLTFNNICIATFKLFPEKFYFSEEFKEFPHIEMLNRTILHLRPVERNYASGSVKTDYELTALGEEIAQQVERDIQQGNSSAPTSPKAMDEHKKTSHNDLQKILTSSIYKTWLENGTLEEMEIWDYYGVTPYTQFDKIKKSIDETRVYAKSNGNNKVVEFLDLMKGQIL
jgi:hypothetical protein